jgi:hypothetical protein
VRQQKPADRTTGDQEGHRVAAAPPGCEWAVSVALHSQTFLLGLRLAAQAQSATTGRSPPGSRSGACGRVVTPAAPLAFLGGSVVGCARPRTRDGTIGPRDRAASQASRLIHESRNLNLPVAPGARDERNALVRWAVLLEG